MTTYYQPLFNYLSNQHGLHLLESDMSEIINIASNMKKQQRIAILESEISRLKVANRNNIYRIEQIESHLAKQHKSANFSKMNSSGIPNSCLNIKPEAPECVANNGVSGGFSQHVLNNLDAILDNAEKRVGMRIHASNLDSPIKPDFIPDWKDAPEDAVCVAMEKDGQWFWWRHKPTPDLNEKGKWNTMHVLNGGVEYGLTETDWFADSATNAHLLPPDYWKGALMMRPDAENDYSHLLPEGYEFCSEEDAEKWVKVEILKGYGNQSKLGRLIDGIFDVDNELHHCYRPIRPIQYKVTTHEITTAIPDPYMPDWSKAPEGAVAHAWDEDGSGYWCMVNIEECMEWVLKHKLSNLTLPADLDWKQSLRVKPSK
jgi:hypothetical protein